MMHEDILGWIPNDTIGLSINSGEEVGEWIDRAAAEITNLRAERDALRGAAIGIRDDLLQRAEWDVDAKLVCAGAGAWYRLNKAIGGDHVG